MSTAVYRDGILAADGMTSAGNGIVDLEAKKIFEINGVGFAAGAGPRAMIVRYMAWLNGLLDERPALRASDDKSEAEVLIVAFDGTLTLHEHEGFEVLGQREFYAIGSGEVAARAALLMGADAVRAVEIASECDAYTGGTICSVEIAPQEAEQEPENITTSPPGWRDRYNLKARQMRQS